MSVRVEAYQNEWELKQLMVLLNAEMPRSVLEVGAMYGGTLQEWLDLVWVEKVVVVDDEMRGAEEWGRWADRVAVELTLLQGASQDPALIAAARREGPFDFVFIDADHTYNAVKADWESYSPMARIVALHDILERPGYGVSQLWSEIKAQPQTRCMEICHNATLPGNEGPCGIGVVWLD